MEYTPLRRAGRTYSLIHASVSGCAAEYTQESEARLFETWRALRRPDGHDATILCRAVLQDAPLATFPDAFRRTAASIGRGCRGLQQRVARGGSWSRTIEIEGRRSLVPRRNMLLEIARDLDEALAFLGLIANFSTQAAESAPWRRLNTYWIGVLAAINASGLIRGCVRYAPIEENGAMVPAVLYP